MCPLAGLTSKGEAVPVCHKCGKMSATADMRRSTTQGLWLCKDKAPCDARRRTAEKLAKKGAP